MIRQGSGGRKVFYSIMLSYLCVVMVTLLFNVAFAYLSNRVLEREVLGANENALSQFRSVLDQQLSEVEAYAYQIATDTVVGRVAVQQRTYKTPEYYYSMKEICSSIVSKRPNQSLIGSSYIWLKDDDCFLTDKGSYSTYEFYQVLQNRGVTLGMEEFRASHDLSSWNRYQVFETRGENPLIAYQLGVMTQSAGWLKHAVVGVMLEQEVIDQVVNQSNWLEVSGITLLNAQGDCLYANHADARRMAREYVQREQDGGERQMVLAGQPCYVVQTQSRVNGWRYLSITPINQLMAARDSMVRMSVVLVLSAFLLAAGLCIIVARRQYAPLGRMVSALGGQGGTMNEYHFVEQAIERMRTEKNMLQSSLNEKVKTLRDSGLIQLLLERTLHSDVAEALMEECEIHLPHGGFHVIIANTWHPEGESTEQDWLLIRNVFSALLKNRALIHYTFKLRGRMVTLVNAEPGNGCTEQLATDCREMAEIVKKRTGSELVTAISTECVGIDGISEAYRQALEVDRYFTFLKGGGVSVYAESFDMNAALLIITPVEETRLKNLLTTGAYEQAEKVFREISTNLFYAEDGTLSMFRYRLFKLIDTMVGIINEILPAALPEIMNGIDPTAQWLECGSAAEMRSMLDELYRRMVDVLMRRRAGDEEKAWFGRAVTAIHRQYDSPDLSVQSLSEEIGVGQTTLSREFKKQLNMSVLDYIHTYRLGVAKELMREEAHGIQEIAEKTGFTNSVTFIRVFKKYEGITPGAFRKIGTIAEGYHE